MKNSFQLLSILTIVSWSFTSCLIWNGDSRSLDKVSAERMKNINVKVMTNQIIHAIFLFDLPNITIQWLESKQLVLQVILTSSIQALKKQIL